MATTSSANSALIDTLRDVLIVSAMLALAPQAATQAAAINQRIGALNLQAEGLTADLVKNQLVLSQVTISQDGYVIRADEARANGIDFKRNEWTFTGNVKITSPTGSSTADQAIGTFRQDAITELHINGHPATFKENRPDLQFMAEGQANRIDYDLAKQTVRLSEDVLLKHSQLESNQLAKYKGQVEYRGQTLLYDMAKQSIIADSKVQITITPDNEPESNSASKNNSGAAQP